MYSHREDKNVAVLIRWNCVGWDVLARRKSKEGSALEVPPRLLFCPFIPPVPGLESVGPEPGFSVFLLFLQTVSVSISVLFVLSLGAEKQSADPSPAKGLERRE